MKAVARFRLGSFVPPGGCFHLARVVYSPGQICRVHRHDFTEICWIESGQAMHLINGDRQRLRPGELTWVRPDDIHGYRTIAGRAFTLVNLAFDPSVMHHIHARYFADSSPWRWAGDAMPASQQLSQHQLSQLAADIEQLSMRRQSRLDLEWFILGLLRLCESRPVLLESQSPVPSWLEQSLADYIDAGDYQHGPLDFARRAGRSIEHVNRTIRQCFGQTTSDLLNNLRLDHAAKLLRMTGQPILQVAMRSGFNNLSYFYRQFHAKFHQTPRHFRLKMHAVLR